MNARQLALDALKLAVLQNGCDMIMTGEELRKCEAAIAALEADIAQAVEPVAWISQESLRRLREGGNDSKGTVPVHASRTYVSKAALFTTPPEPAVNAELLEALDDLPASGWTTDINGAPVDALVAKWRVLEIAKATS